MIRWCGKCMIGEAWASVKSPDFAVRFYIHFFKGKCGAVDT
jgi:hypothetical protein